MATISAPSAYLVIEKERYYNQARIVSMTKNKPALKSGQIAVRVRVNVPMDLLVRFIPEVSVDLEERNVLVFTAELDDLSPVEVSSDVV